jgi:hypothetical protein
MVTDSRDVIVHSAVGIMHLKMVDKAQQSVAAAWVWQQVVHGTEVPKSSVW